MSNDGNRKNSRLRIALVLVVLLSVFVFAYADFTGSTIRAIKGAQNVVYPVYLDNDEAVAGFQVEINYSTDYLTLVDVQPTSRLSNATIIYNNQSPIVRVAVLVNNASNKITYGNGSVLNLIFDVDEGAVAGNYSVDLSNLISVNISTITLNSSEANGLFEIVEPYNLTFLPPISNFENFTLQDGATLPFKFNVTDENGFVYDNSVLVRVYNETLGIDKTYNASGTGSDYVSIDEANGKYIINIHTGQLNMPEGLYDIEVTFDNYQKGEIGFELVDKSSGVGKGKPL